MYNDKELATELNSLLSRASHLFDDVRDLLSAGVKAGKCTQEDRSFCSTRLSLVLGREFLEIFEQLYWEHPDLIPEGAKPWPRVRPEKTRQMELSRQDLYRSEMLAFSRILWDVFQESNDLDVRAKAADLQLRLPKDIGAITMKEAQQSNEKPPSVDGVKYYKEIAGLLEKHIKSFDQ